MCALVVQQHLCPLVWSLYFLSCLSSWCHKNNQFKSPVTWNERLKQADCSVCFSHANVFRYSGVIVVKTVCSQTEISILFLFCLIFYGLIFKAEMICCVEAPAARSNISHGFKFCLFQTSSDQTEHFIVTRLYHESLFCKMTVIVTIKLCFPVQRGLGHND